VADGREAARDKTRCFDWSRRKYVFEVVNAGCTYFRVKPRKIPWGGIIGGVCTLLAAAMGILAMWYPPIRDQKSNGNATSVPTFAPRNPPHTTPPVSSSSPIDTPDRIPPITPATDDTPSPLPLNARSVLLIPAGFLSTTVDETFTDDFRAYASAAIRAAVLRTGNLEIPRRDILDAIAKELLINDEIRRVNGHPSITAKAYDMAAKHGARWILIPEVNVEHTIHRQDASGGLPVSEVTVRVEIDPCDVMSRVVDSPPFQGNAISKGELVSDPKIEPRRERVRHLIDSACTNAFLSPEFKVWLKKTQNK